MFERGAPVSYLAASELSPWQWSRDGRVIVWFDGTTVAFREELVEILGHLAPRGLPSFGAIVLLLAALKGKLPDAWWMRAHRDDAPQSRIESALDGVADMTSLSRRTVPALATPRGKAALIEVLLEGESSAATPDEARALVRELESAAAEGELWALASVREAPRILGDVEALGRGWRRFDAARFELRFQTGLDRLPVAPPEIDEEVLPPSERARKLLEELARDEAHAGLAKLTRDLMAAIYFPHRLLPRDEAPSGGYSDVANRGSLDRLLLSELAHDDLTLSVRVALNEALYMKREPPAEHPEGELTLLLDSGLRLWGVPRVFATAVALALIAVQSRKRDVRVFRAKGGRVEEVKLLTREGLAEHLSSLEPDLNPVRAVSAFVDKLDEQAGSEGVLVTEADTLEDPELRAELRRFDFRSLYLASVSRQGSFRLFSYPRFDGKPLSAAELDLETIVPREGAGPGTGGAASRPLLDPDFDPELPLILAVRPFPFLLPVRGRVELVTHLRDGGGACVTEDGRVLVWTERGLGTRVVATGLSWGQPKLLALTEDEVLLVKVRGASVRITRIERSTGKETTDEHGLRTSLAEVLFPGGGDTILLVYAHQADAVDARSGVVLASCPISGASNRGYVMGVPFRRLAWDGVALTLEPFEVQGVSASDVLWVFDSVGWEGPLALVRGEGIRSSTGDVVLEGDVVAFSGVARDGSRLAARDADGYYFLFDLERLTVTRAPDYEVSWLETKERYVPTRNLRTRIVSLSASRTGGLVIGNAKGKYFELTARNGALALTDCAREGQLRALKPHPVDPRYGCELSVATFGDGTRVFLDSRGPLHLKSSDPRLEEVSVVLTESTAVAWSSNGETHGPRFFLGAQGNVPAAAMIEKIRRILEPVA